MAIFVDTETRLVVQGLTGSEGRFHGLRNRAYGTNLVAGVTPGKGGPDVESGSPSSTPSPPPSTRRREHVDDLRPGAVRGGRHLRGDRRGRRARSSIVTEGVPAHEMLRIHACVHPKRADARAELPRDPLRPGRRTSGSSPRGSSLPGGLGIVCRWGRWYQIGHELPRSTSATTTIVGIGQTRCSGRASSTC